MKIFNWLIVASVFVIATSLPAEHHQSGCVPRADVIFLVDGSDSISEQEFEQQRELIRRFTNFADIGTDSIHVGFIVVSTTVGDKLVPTNGSSSAQVLSALSGMSQPQQGSRTDLGLVEMEQMFGMHGRPGVVRIGVLLTDGRAKYVRAAEGEAQILKDSGVFLIAVGVGRLIKFETLEKMASTTSNAYHLEPIDLSSNMLAQTVMYLGAEACSTGQDVMGHVRGKTDVRQMMVTMRTEFRNGTSVPFHKLKSGKVTMWQDAEKLSSSAQLPTAAAAPPSQTNPTATMTTTTAAPTTTSPPAFMSTRESFLTSHNFEFPHQNIAVVPDSLRQSSDRALHLANKLLASMQTASGEIPSLLETSSFTQPQLQQSQIQQQTQIEQKPQLQQPQQQKQQQQIQQPILQQQPEQKSHPAFPLPEGTPALTLKSLFDLGELGIQLGVPFKAAQSKTLDSLSPTLAPRSPQTAPSVRPRSPPTVAPVRLTPSTPSPRVTSTTPSPIMFWKPSTTMAMPTMVETGIMTSTAAPFIQRVTHEDVTEQCSKSRYVDGVGYTFKPYSCTSFLQCFNNNGQLVVKEARCPFQTFYDDMHAVCRHYEKEPCWRDPCFDYSVKSYKHVGNCRAYWTCKSGLSVPSCCPAGSSYVPGQECVRDFNCTDVCMDFGNINAVTVASKCKLLPMETDSRFYFERVSGVGWVIRTCAIGSTYNTSSCGCETSAAAAARVVTVNRTDVQVTAVCKPELYLDFQAGFRDQSGNNLALGNTNADIEGGAGMFNGRAYLKLWRFSGVSLGQKVTISFRFRLSVTSIKGKLMHIVSNCCHGCTSLPKPSINIGIIPGKDGGVAAVSATTKAAGEVFAFIPYKDTPTGWNDLHFTYDGSEITGTVNGITARKPIIGDIESRTYPLMIGACGTAGMYTGYLDEFKFYMCNK